MNHSQRQGGNFFKADEYQTETRSLNTPLETKNTCLDYKYKLGRLESPSNIPGSKYFIKLSFRYRK